MARILSISYDATLLLTRELLLRHLGHDVTSAEGFSKAYQACARKDAKFDLIILGHSIPHEDKEEMIKHCADACSCPVLALLRANENPLAGAIQSVDSSDPQALIAAVHEILE